LTTPGWTTATWSSTEISRIWFMRTVDSNKHPSMAFAAPDNPVRAPWVTTGTPNAAAARRTSTTSAVDEGRASTRGIPAVQKVA
jgi:hypothetical protein